MFSSFTNSIASMARGPRAIIASQIAQVLGEYFVVNPDDIESSLLSDAKIVLRDTKIRKKEYCNASSSAPDTVITVSGIVQEVIFSWKWSFRSAGGGTGTSSSSSSRGAGMVQDAALSIRGLKVILEWDRRVSDVYDDDILNTLSKVNESNSEKAGFLQNYIQQIVDHLTVKVDNFEVIFQAKGGPSMDVRGKDLALVTLASAKVPSDTSVATKTILSQSISIEMFAITVNDNQDEYSLIEPFGYTASVTRLFGKRFQDGIFSGLDVAGLPKVQEKVKIHVGPRQIHVLCALSMYMAPTKSSYMEKERALMEQQCHNKPSDSDSVNASDFSTMFTFPLPEVTLVISQDITMSPYEPTEITIPSVVVSFRSDGGIFRVEGCGDMDCNGRTTLQMLDGACWDLDLIAQTFIIEQKDDYKKHDKTNCESCLLTLVLNEESLLPLVSNVHSVINNHEIDNLRAAFETSVTQLETLRGTNQSLKPWIIAVDGSIQLIAESSFGGTRDVDRINATVRSIRAVTVVDKSKGSYMFNEFDCGGIKVMSNIDIDAWLDVPTFRLAENIFSFNGIMNFCMQSVEKGRKLQSFALRFKAIFSDSSISDGSTPAMLPFDVFMIGARLHLSEGAGLTEKGSVVKLEGIRIAIEGTNMTATIEEVSNVHIPEVLILTEPTHNIYAKYDGNHLLLDLNSVKCNIPLGDCGEELSSKKSFDAMVFCLPISIQMRINWFIVESLGNKNGISIQDIELGLKPNGSTILIQTERELTFKLYESTDDWLQAELKIISANVGIENGVLDIKRFECRGVDIGPTSQSCGDLCAVIPPCNHDGETLAIDNFITVNITSVDAANNVLSLVQKVSSLIFKSSSSFELPFPIDLQGIKISLAEPKSDVLMLKVKGSSTNILCSKIDADVAKKACVSADEIAMNLQTSELDIGRINSFTVTDIFSLSKPLLRSKMTYRNTYCISLPNEVQIKMQIPLESSPSSHEYKLDTNNTGDQMDFPVQIHLNQLTIINMGRKINLRVFNLHLGTRPSSNGSNDFQYQAQSTRGTDLTLSVGKASCELFELSELNISLLLQPRDFATFRNLKIGLESVKVTAGFSNIDWACFFPQKNDCSGAKRLSIFSTPFPEIDSFPLSVSYKGKVLSTRSNIQVPPFSGNATTTSDHIILYYKNVVLERIPGFLTNVEFMGENLIDSSLKNTGMSVVGAATKTLSGAGLGSMAGVAVADAIRAGIDSGKKSRNANASDGYKFGDFTRGIIRGTRENAEIGAKMRGDPGTYVPGDLIVGSSKAAGEYVKNNKAKLSTAGGSGIGATVGLAVAGPLGFVVGSYLGGKTAQGIVVDDNQGQSKTKDAPQATLCKQLYIQKQGDVAQKVHRKPQSCSNSSLPSAKISNIHQHVARRSNISSSKIYSYNQSEVQEDFLSGSPPSDRGLFSHSSSNSDNKQSYVGQNAKLTTDSRTAYDKNSNSFTKSPSKFPIPTKKDPVFPAPGDPFDFITAEIPSRHAAQPSPGFKDAPDNINLGPKASSDINRHPSSDFGVSVDLMSQDPFSYNDQQKVGQSIAVQTDVEDFFRDSNCKVNTQYTRNNPITSTTGDYDFFNDKPLKEHGTSYGRSSPSLYQRGENQTGRGTQKPSHVPQNNNTKKDGYKFGDLTKSIIAKGKKSDGRKDDSSYKFGDFTRGLFS